MQSIKKFDLYSNPDPEKSSFFTREGIDILNSLCWLLMDACWMFSVPKVGLIVFGIPTLITAWTLFYRERHRGSNFTNLATNCWISMNLFWMLSDTFPVYEARFLVFAKISLVVGMVFVFLGAYRSGNVSDAIAHYKRYKSLGNPRLRVVEKKTN